MKYKSDIPIIDSKGIGIYFIDEITQLLSQNQSTFV